MSAHEHFPADSSRQQPYTALPLFDSKHLSRELEFDDNELLHDLYSEYVLQLVALQTRIAPPNCAQLTPEEVALFSHRLKSSSHAVGAMQLARCLQQLEQAAQHDPATMAPLLTLTLSLVRNTHAALAAEINRLGGENQ